MKLNPKHYRFIAEVIKGESAGDAAEKAGYSAKSARTQGPRLLQNDVIKREIEKQLNVAGLTPQRIITELYSLYEAARDNGSYGPAKDIMHLIGRHNGMFQDLRKVEHKHSHAFEQLLDATRSVKDVTPTPALLPTVQDAN